MLIPANKSQDWIETYAQEQDEGWMFEANQESTSPIMKQKLTHEPNLNNIVENLPNDDEEILKCLDNTVLEE